MKHYLIGFCGTLAVIIATIIGFTIFAPKSHSEVYARTAVVMDVDRLTDTVTVEDSTGHIWQFSECDDWEIGDGVSMVMDDNGTTPITDDEIVSVRFTRIDNLMNVKKVVKDIDNSQP